MSQQNKSYFFDPAFGDRLKNGDKPNQVTFQTLLDSLTFKSEVTDQAATDNQGLVRIADDAVAKTSTNPDSTWVYAAKVSQLPTVENSTGNQDSIDTSFIDFTGDALDITADVGTTTRNKYVAKLSSPFKSWLVSVLNSLKASVTSLASGVANALMVDGSNSMEAPLNMNANAITGVTDIRDFDGVLITSGGNRLLYDFNEDVVARFDDASAGFGIQYGTYIASLKANLLTNHRLFRFPDKAGIFALTSDIPLSVLSDSGSPTLTTKVINIGDWNMDTTPTITVPHLLDQSKIRAVSVAIRTDLDVGPQTFLSPWSDPQAISGNPVYLSHNIVGSNISISRQDTTFFDSINFNATSYNRGFVTITYEL